MSPGPRLRCISLLPSQELRHKAADRKRSAETDPFLPPPNQVSCRLAVEHRLHFSVARQPQSSGVAAHILHGRLWNIWADSWPRIGAARHAEELNSNAGRHKKATFRWRKVCCPRWSLQDSHDELAGHAAPCLAMQRGLLKKPTKTKSTTGCSAIATSPWQQGDRQGRRQEVHRRRASGAPPPEVMRAG